MFNKITTNYNGGDATAEIIIMLLVAFILGFILRWLWEKVFFKEEYEEFIIEDSSESSQEAGNTKKTVSKIRQKPKDLTIIEGIGPKIEKLLKADGINTWEDLSKTDVEILVSILKKAGDKFSFHNPKTWPQQATLAFQGRWDDLEEFQDFLNGRKK